MPPAGNKPVLTLNDNTLDSYSDDPSDPDDIPTIDTEGRQSINYGMFKNLKNQKFSCSTILAKIIININVLIFYCLQ